ncbi:hypothetical protein D9M70_506310 [compost metagenome]
MAPGQRLDAGAHLLADARGGEQAEAHHHADEGRGFRRQAELEPVLQRLRQQVRDQEVPEEQLHQQRHVAEDFHVGGSDAGDPAVRHGAHHAEHGAEQQGDDPGGEGDGDGPAQAGDEPVQIALVADPGGLEEHAPVPVVVHEESLGCTVFKTAAGHPRTRGGPRRRFPESPVEE